MPVKLPSITVVTPCLNAAATIGEALESVRSQGYPGLEHLVMRRHRALLVETEEGHLAVEPEHVVHPGLLGG
jgi:hypothetical protein